MLSMLKDYKGTIEINGDWYFSLDDRCVWYIVKDMKGGAE